MARTWRASKQAVRRGPLLIESCRNKDSWEIQRIMKMSLKKLNKIGESASLLQQVVVISNTVEYLRRSGDTRTSASKKESSINTYAVSNYSTEEEQILSSIHLPPPITPISDQTFEFEEDIIDSSDDSSAQPLTGRITN